MELNIDQKNYIESLSKRGVTFLNDYYLKKIEAMSEEGDKKSTQEKAQRYFYERVMEIPRERIILR